MGNVLLHDLPNKQLQRLQKVQNWAARLAVGVRKYDHVTRILTDLHWLPVEALIHYEILLLVYRCLNAWAPTYLTDILTIKETLRNLCTSSDRSVFFIPRSKHSWRVVPFPPLHPGSGTIFHATSDNSHSISEFSVKIIPHGGPEKMVLYQFNVSKNLMNHKRYFYNLCIILKIFNYMTFRSQTWPQSDLSFRSKPEI